MATRDSDPSPGSPARNPGDTAPGAPHRPGDAPPGSLVPPRPPGDAPPGSLVPRPPAPSRPPRPGPPRPPQGRARRRLRSRSGAQTPPGERRPSGPSSPIVMLRDARSAPGPLPSLRDKPKTIRVITKDVVRELIIPRDRAPASLIIGKKDFERIQESAWPLPQEERGERLRTLRSRQDAAFESLRKVRSAELRRAELQDRGDLRGDREEEEEEEEKEKPERPQRARKPSGPSSPIVMLRDARSAPGPLPSLRDKPKTIRVITRDVVRELIIPRERSPASLIIGKKDFERIQEEARGPVQELADRLRTLKSRQDAAFEALSQARSEEQRREELRDPGDRRSDLDQEMEQEKRELLERAARMRLEQEDEMRELNSLLLAAKCSSILDHQVAEKRLIHEELAAEDRRLNGIMEAEREKGLEFQEELERRRKQELISTKLEVLRQMEQHWEQRALRAEQKFQEGRRVLERLEQMKREDREAWQQQQQHKRQLLAEMRRVDSENERLRQRERDRDRRDEQRALEEQRLKAEREAALEAERARLRRERQRELDRVRDMQERDRGWQEAREALRTQRSQEAAERAWRRRELEQERRRARLVRELQRERGEQVALRRQQLALHLEQERRDFLTLLSGHQEQLARERQEQERRERARRDHAEALRGQIRELRQRRQRDRAAAIEEGQRQLREARERCQRLAQIGQQKLQRLRDTGVPDRYCARVERKAWGTASAATS